MLDKCENVQKEVEIKGMNHSLAITKGRRKK